ncbi:MAG: glycosyltransferase, partial [Candidatus Cloacimonetes bacterium]|nr:glycosyltransferase [Candidatus Cloacimonadota bacterium]
LFSYEKEAELLTETIIAFPNFHIKFNNSAYYGDIERKIIITNEKRSIESTWTHQDDEINYPLNGGNIFVKIPWFRWRINENEWYNEPINRKLWYKDFLENGDLLVIENPNEDETISIFGKTDGQFFKVVKNRTGKYEIGRTIYANENKKDISVYLVTSNQKDDKSLQTPANFTYDFIAPNLSHTSMIWSLYKKGLSIKPDIVLCIEPITMFAALYLKQKLRCHTVYDAHEFYPEAFAERHKIGANIYKYIEKRLANNMDSVLAVNSIIAGRFKRNSVMCANFPSQGSFVSNLDSEKLYDIIYAGCLWFERGLKIYLETALLFKKANKQFKMLLIGSFKDTATERFYHGYIQQNQLQEYILYQPFKPNTLVLQDMQHSKIGLFLGDVEHSPRYDKSISMKVLEYFCQGIPAVVNDLDVLGKFVTEAKGGWIVKYSAQALYDVLVEAFENPILIKEKAKNGYDYCQKYAVWENQENELYKAFGLS